MPTTPTADGVELLIDGQLFRFWTHIEIGLAVDNYSTVNFEAPFEPENRVFRETFRPFTFKPVEVRVGGQTLFNGTLVGVLPEVTPDSSKVQVTAYSLPGVLSDCTPPVSALPLEFKKLGLKAITQRLVEPFGLDVEFRAPEGARFEKVAIEKDQRIQDFLADLGRQRNLVFSNTPDGAVLCWQSSEPGTPVARFVQGELPLANIEPSFTPQEYFSEITGFASAKRRRRGAKYTVQNPWLTDILRPLSFEIEDTETADTPEATRAKLGRMFANMASFAVSDLPTWRDPRGALWTPNTTVTLKATSAMVYRETELLVRKVNLRQDANTQTASLNLVLPGAFSGKVPEVLPWVE